MTLLSSMLTLSACGYSSGVITPGGGDLRIFVPLSSSTGADVDAVGLVDRETRRAVGRARGVRVVGADAADARF